MSEQKEAKKEKAPEEGKPASFRKRTEKIGPEEIAEARRKLLLFKQGKARLDQKIVENDEWYRLRHWAAMRGREDEIEPASGWLLNCILSKHADAMDNFPRANVLPREEADRAEARILSSVIPVILDRCGFEKTYSDEQMYKMKTGCGCFAVTWDPDASNGIGDIAVSRVDLLNLYWEPGVSDIQDSSDLFYVTLADKEAMHAKYPVLADVTAGTGESVGVAKYLYDDTVDTSSKYEVVDWYYKRSVNGRKVLHYVRFVNGTVLFATENETAPRTDGRGNVVGEPLAVTGLYDHGDYPFVPDVLFPIEGTPAGFGYIDIGKDAQAYVDRGNQAIMRNLLASARPRYFIRSDGAVKESEFADLHNDFIHVDGNLGQDSILPVTQYPLAPVYAEVVNRKIEELKETTGNRDVSNGGTSGVTAAAAIAALQEASSKLSRDCCKGSFRAFRRVTELVIELIRQFYSFPRSFRITGEAGKEDFVLYTNVRLRDQAIETEYGVGGGYRRPAFDLEITAEKQSPYTKMAQNELALQLYTAGFFDPARAEEALSCLDMMDFDRKAFVVKKITENASALSGRAAYRPASFPAADGNGAELLSRARTAEMTAPR